MEGNLSISQAHASVADNDHLAEEPSDNGAWQTSTKRRKRLVRVSTFLTGLWLGLFAAGLVWAKLEGQLDAVSPAHVAVFIAAAGVPLCLIWIVSLVLQRADPLLERRLAIARTLNSTIAPVDAAEAKLDKMLERLRRDVGTVDQTVLLASERIGALEERFKAQVSELFSATTDAEAKSASIREQLKRERESMQGLTELLQSHLDDIRTTMANATDSTIQAEMKSRDSFHSAAATFEDQYASLMSASTTAVEGISSVMNGLAERTTALDAAALAATQKLGKGVSALAAHEDDYRGFIDEFSQGFKDFDGAIDSRLVALEAAQARLTRTGETLFTQLRSVSDQSTKSVDDALERTRESVSALDEHQTKVGQTSASILSALGEQQTTAQESAEVFLQHLNTMKDALDQSVETAQGAHSHASETFEAVLVAHVLSWQKALEQFSQMLTHDTERAGSIAASRLLKAGETIEATAETVRQRIDTAANQQTQALEAIAASLTERLNQAEQTAAEHAEVLQKEVSHLMQQRDDIDASALSLQARMEQVPEALKETVNQVQQSLAQSQSSMAETLSNLSHSAKELSALPASLSDAWSPQFEQLQSASDEAEEKQRQRLNELQSFANSLEKTCAAALDDIGVRVDAVAKKQNTQSNQAEAFLGKLKDVTEAITQVEKGLTDGETRVLTLSEHLQEVQVLAKNISELKNSDVGDLPGQWRQRLEELSDAASALKTQAQSDGRAILEEYESALTSAGSMTDGLSNQLSDTINTITKDADKAVDLARMKWAALSEERQRTALEAVERFSHTVRQSMDRNAGEISQRLDVLGSHTKQTLEQLSQDTAAQLKGGEEMLQRVRALTKRINEDTSSDLIKSSSLIIDALNSGAIDISKALRSDLSDEDWNKYLAGDKSLFTRKTVELVSKSQRDAIRAKMEEDADLKSAAQNYLKDFELLMSRAMAGGEPTSFSVALISSDVGKLYVTLSQAMRRLN